MSLLPDDIEAATCGLLQYLKLSNLTNFKSTGTVHSLLKKDLDAHTKQGLSLGNEGERDAALSFTQSSCPLQVNRSTSFRWINVGLELVRGLSLADLLLEASNEDRSSSRK